MLEKKEHNEKRNAVWRDSRKENEVYRFSAIKQIDRISSVYVIGTKTKSGVVALSTGQYT